MDSRYAIAAKLISDRKYWLLGIAAGLSVGLLGVLWALFVEYLGISGLALFAAIFPAMFGAAFSASLRSTVGASIGRCIIFTLGVTAAHWGALLIGAPIWFLVMATAFLGDPIGDRLGLYSYAFCYGAGFASGVSLLIKFLFPRRITVKLFAIAVLVSGMAAVSYFPFEELLPRITGQLAGEFISDTAYWAAFGLIYTATAMVLGWQLLVKEGGRPLTV